ncbi:hypothetical protein Rhopal_002460-T1 [Rhodotorula paludigena]|uniref:Uncharacterized protein n=1 Tax=Rhodotorula paludigena TaxID=86838 RepID=A0AAV5GHV5_9BASI|nr:hypothetical protein Rhopal_002460-T1 [Rhodotorula paludigena]
MFRRRAYVLHVAKESHERSLPILPSLSPRRDALLRLVDSLAQLRDISTDSSVHVPLAVFRS